MTSASIFKCIKDKDVLTLRRILSSSDHGHTIKDQMGRTPLHLAASLGAYECVKELLSKKAACDICDQSGNLPIHLACMSEQGGREIVAELLNGHGRKLTAKKKNIKTGHTPLHLAAMHGNLEVVVALLDAGVRWDAKDAAGNQPMDLVPLASPHYELLIQILGSGDATPARSHLPAHPPHNPHTPSRASAPSTPATATSYATTPASKTPGLRASMQGDISSRTPTARAGAGSRIGSGLTPGASKIGQGAGPSPLLQPRPSGIPGGIPGAHPPSGHDTSAATPPHPTSRTRLIKTLPTPTHTTDTPGAIPINYTAAATPPPTAVTPGTASHRTTATPIASSAGGPSGGGAAGAGAGAMSSAMLLVAELSQRVDVLQSRADASEAARREMEEHLLQAQAMVKEQAERLDAAESRLSQVEEERAQEAAQRAATATPPDVQHLDELQSQQDSLLKSMIQMQSKYDTLLGSVSKLQAQMASVNPFATPPPTPTGLLKSHSVATPNDQSLPQLEELSVKVQALTAKVVAVEEMEPLKSRISRLEALGIADQLAILQLRAQQLGNSLSDISSQQLELGNTLSGLLSSQAEHQQQVAGSRDVVVLAGGDTTVSSAGAPAAATSTAVLEAGLSKAVAQLAEQETAQQAMQQQLTAMQQQLSDLSSKPPSTPAPVSTPAPSGIPGAPPTPNTHYLTPQSSSKSMALAFASAASTTQALDELQHEHATLHKDVSALKLAVDELRCELAVTTGSLKRDWSAAVEEAAQRYAEQTAELSQKEERVKSVRDSMLAEGDARAVAAALEQRVTSALAGIDTRLGLLQHKVEVVEYQVQAGVEAEAVRTPYVSQPGSSAPTSTNVSSGGAHPGLPHHNYHSTRVSSIPRAVAEEREAAVAPGDGDTRQLGPANRVRSADVRSADVRSADVRSADVRSADVLPGEGEVFRAHTRTRVMEGHVPYAGRRKGGAGPIPGGLPKLFSKLFNRKPHGWVPVADAYTTHNLIFNQADSGDELSLASHDSVGGQQAPGDEQQDQAAQQHVEQQDQAQDVNVLQPAPGEQQDVVQGAGQLLMSEVVVAGAASDTACVEPAAAPAAAATPDADATPADAADATPAPASPPTLGLEGAQAAAQLAEPAQPPAAAAVLEGPAQPPVAAEVLAGAQSATTELTGSSQAPVGLTSSAAQEQQEQEPQLSATEQAAAAATPGVDTTTEPTNVAATH